MSFDPHVDPASPPRVFRWRRLWRRLGLVFAALVLLALVGGLIFHLIGRAQYDEAVEHFVAEMGSDIPSLEPDDLQARIAALAPESPPETENAAHFLITGSAALAWADEELRLVRALEAMPLAEWTEEQESRLRDLFERNEGALATLAQAVPIPGSDYGIVYDDLLRAEIPNLLKIVNAGRLLSLRARLDFADGDVERGWIGVRTLHRLQESLRREPLLIFDLIAHVIERVQYRAITEVLTSRQPWAQEPALVERFAAVLPTEDPRLFSRQVVALDAAVTSTALVDAWPEDFQLKKKSLLSHYLWGRRAAARYLDQGRMAAALSERPFGEGWRNPPRPGPLDVLGNLGVTYRNAIAKGQLIASQRRLVRVALELRRAGLEQGTYGDSCPRLDLLSRPDPFVGEPLRCEVRGDGSLHLELPGAMERIEEVVRRSPELWMVAIDLPAPSPEVAMPV